MSNSDLRVSPEHLRRRCDPAIFSFQHTGEITPLEDAIGQERAVRAIEFGIDIESPGYHIFALGPGGTGKTTMVRGFLRRRSAGKPVPDDWCYANNFDDPDKPLALRLTAGMGRQFKADMEQLVEELKLTIPRAFEGEEFNQAIERLRSEVKKVSETLFEALNQHAAEKNFKLVPMPQGMAFVPLRNGEMMSREEMAALDEATRERIEADMEALQDETRDILRQMRQQENEARQKQREMARQGAQFATEHLFEELRRKYSAFETAAAYLERVHADVFDHLGMFLAQEDSSQDSIFTRDEETAEDRYRVNLIVDNTETEGAPVIYEGDPNAHNLIGRVEHEVTQGALVTDFTMIKAGALHRANGGYLVLEARSMLTKPFAWQMLKSALKNNEIRLGLIGEEYQVTLTRTLQPEPIPLDVRVVMIGDPLLYYLLYELDEDFQELFKVKADFATEMNWDEGAPQLYARFIAMICQTEKLRSFAPSGVARLIEESARSVSDQHKLATRFGDVVDLIRQANYWASRSGNEYITDMDVKKAVDEKRYRVSRVEERLREMIAEGTLLIDTQGQEVGQINGLSVLSMGDYAFGKPSRITARTYVGNAGMVNIEREIELGGPIHNKGVLILSGYLGGQYAQEKPLMLSASLTFEQLYEGVEGDSASSAELYALLSSLSGYALRQDLAVTGSVNQRGQIQAIGGVNEKVEGFYDVCRLRGLTGTQGVIIPQSNVRHLMLREDVVEAVREGQFHIFAVASVDEGIELLTGLPAGERQPDGTYPPDTVHHAVQKRLTELAERTREALRNGGEKDLARL